MCAGVRTRFLWGAGILGTHWPSLRQGGQFRPNTIAVVRGRTVERTNTVNPLPPGKFFYWILMKIRESVRLGVLRKVINGNFEEEKFCPRYLSNKNFYLSTTFHNFLLFLCFVLLNSNPLEFFKYLYPFLSYIKNKFFKNFS